MDLASLTIEEFLQRLGSSEPTPGGGALSALAGAMAASMLTMVCNLTVGRPRYADVEEEAQAILGGAGRLQADLLALANADAEAYAAVRDAYRLPRESDQDKELRAAAIEHAMHTATDVPVQTAEAARAVLDLAARSATASNVTVVADVAVAAHLALAAMRGGVDQAELNLASVSDQAFSSQMAARLSAATSGAERVATETQATVRRRAAGG